MNARQVSTTNPLSSSAHSAPPPMIDPTVGGEVVTTDIACDVPDLSNPYDAASRVDASVVLFLIPLCGVVLSHLLW